MSSDKRAQLEILLVEDNDDDAAWTIDALSREEVRCNVTRAEDGEEALNILHKQGKFAGTTSPHLLLLDLSLPKKSGLEVFREVRNSSNPELQNLPVVIITVSTEIGDAKEAIRLGVDTYISKPVKLEELVVAVKRLLANHKLSQKQREDLEAWAREYREA